MPADPAYILVEVLIAVLSVLGNMLVCWAVCLNTNLQTITNFFVVSLAVADIAVGVLAIPFAIAISTGFCSNFYGCLFMACFLLVLTQSSIFSLLAIAIDRYIAIKLPLRYSSLVTDHRAQAIIALCWLLSAGIGLTPLLGWHPLREGEVGLNLGSGLGEGSCPAGLVRCLFEKVVLMEYMVYFNFLACVLVPLLLMLAIYLAIFLAARQQLRLMGRASRSGHNPGSTLQREVQAAKSLAIIVGLFVVCWLPLHIINCFTLLCPACARPPSWLMNVAILLSHANSVLNPFIYAYRIEEFRLTFRKIICRHVLGQQEAQGSGGHWRCPAQDGALVLRIASRRSSCSSSSCESSSPCPALVSPVEGSLVAPAYPVLAIIFCHSPKVALCHLQALRNDHTLMEQQVHEEPQGEGGRVQSSCFIELKQLSHL